MSPDEEERAGRTCAGLDAPVLFAAQELDGAPGAFTEHRPDGLQAGVSVGAWAPRRPLEYRRDAVTPADVVEHGDGFDRGDFALGHRREAGPQGVSSPDRSLPFRLRGVTDLEVVRARPALQRGRRREAVTTASGGGEQGIAQARQRAARPGPPTSDDPPGPAGGSSAGPARGNGARPQRSRPCAGRRRYEATSVLQGRYDGSAEVIGAAG